MRSAVDTSILLDVFLKDPRHAAASLRILEEHAGRGSLVVCPVVYAECAAAFANSREFEIVAGEMGLLYDNFPPECALLAARMWQDYRRRGGPRKRMISDFLVGAHAQLRADVLLTRDRGYYRSYFQGLSIASP